MSKRSVSSSRSEEMVSEKKLESDPLFSYMSGIDSGKNEIYNSDLKHGEHKPWWSTTINVTEPILFGTWDGVYTSCILNTFGVVIFLRSGWVVGNAGLLLALLMIFMTLLPVYICVGAAAGICQRAVLKDGGVYALLSFVLGYRTASSIAFIYCLGQACSCSLFVSGLSESITSLAGITNPWAAKGISIIFLLSLLAINLAGIHWVIRLQVILLCVIIVSVLSFFIGSFLPHDKTTGVEGYSSTNMKNNLDPDFLPGENFISVLGVIFPTVCGIFTGLNMSGQLKNPRENFPVGTIFSVFTVTILYTSFILIFAAVVDRNALKSDYNIAAKVAAWAPLLLSGLYVSALSAALGGITSSPRLLQSIATTTKLPALSVFTKTMGENQIPVPAMFSLASLSVLCALFGDVNILGPIVTIPFLVTYAAIAYSYFLLALVYDNKHKRDVAQDKVFTNRSNDMENLFPERKIARDFEMNEATPKLFKKEPKMYAEDSDKSDKTIREKPKIWYSFFINRWSALFGAIYCMIIVFLLQWSYALLVLAIMLFIYVIAGTGQDGLAIGVAGEISIWSEISNCLQYYYANFLDKFFCCYGQRLSEYEHLKGESIKRKLDAKEQFIPEKDFSDITRIDLDDKTVNQEGEDYPERGKYHQTKDYQVQS